LQLDIEQKPSTESRVYLSQNKDANDMPMLCIYWKPGTPEWQTTKTFIEKFKQEWQRFDLGSAIWNERLYESEQIWLSNISDAFHQAGTTRMSDDSRQGVVNANLQVHGVENLYIASCSVFPTSGTANPTFTLMALSLRLADFLKAVNT